MAGPNILLTRIDNRLIHGQVGVTWTRTLGANLIVVVDEEAAEKQKIFLVCSTPQVVRALVQGIGLAIMAIIVGIDFWLEALFIFRPIIVCTLSGLILGDVQLGLLCGGITELAFAGLTPAGGTQPPNPVLAGVMTVVIAYTTGTEPAGAMALALPFSFLMQYVILFCYSSFSFFMKGADKAAEDADTNGICSLFIN